jgi:hypothetical protein
VGGLDEMLSFLVAHTNGILTERLKLDNTGNVGVGATTPWRTLSVTGTVGFDGLTSSTGAGSLCFDSNKQVVYNSASDSCPPPARRSMRSIHWWWTRWSKSSRCNPVTFVYDDGDGRVRYVFVAEDTAAVDAHLATYNAAGAVLGIDDCSILAVLVGAIKDLWAKVLALIESDEAQNARIQQLEEEVAVLKAAAGAATANPGGPAGAPGGSSASAAQADTDTATTTTSSGQEPAAGVPDPGGSETPVSSSAGQSEAVDAPSNSSSDNEPAAGAGSVGTSAAPDGGSASGEAEAIIIAPNDDSPATPQPANDNEPVLDDATEPAPDVAEDETAVDPPLPEPANGNWISVPLPATGTEWVATIVRSLARYTQQEQQRRSSGLVSSKVTDRWQTFARRPQVAQYASARSFQHATRRCLGTLAGGTNKHACRRALTNAYRALIIPHAHAYRPELHYMRGPELNRSSPTADDDCPAASIG